MKKTVFLLLMACISSSVWSQVTLGGKASPFGYAYQFGKGMDGINMIYSYHVGGMAQFQLTKWFALQTELNFERKGRHLSDDDFSFTFGKDVFDMRYLTIPLLFHFNTPGVVKFYGQFGPYVGFLVYAHRKYERHSPGNNYFEIDEDVKDHYKSVNAGVAAGLGISFPLAPGLVAFLESRSSISFINAYDTPEIYVPGSGYYANDHSVYNTAWHLMFGIGYRFPGK
ncbi:MAG: porin family protein [Bacteroidales bacterium]